jgi:NAD(P)-dependent dehydrogenase (short-subunit alcohol dehydrogenase family)
VHAGVNVRKPLLETSAAEFDKVVGLNLRGSFFVMRAAGRRMAAQGRGSIILFSSIRALTVEPGQGVYAATKAGTLQLIRALAAELGPGGRAGQRHRPRRGRDAADRADQGEAGLVPRLRREVGAGRWAQPSEMVGPAIYLASEAASFVTGTLTIVDGGWTAVDGRFSPPL